LEISHSLDNLIEQRTSRYELDARLLEQQAMGSISGEQWFRDTSLWYELAISYNNPYNHRNVHAELSLLHDARKRLSPQFQDRTLVFYGIGTGDTEMELVSWQVERAGYAEIVGIDINKRFLEKFVGGLRNKNLEGAYRILFRGYSGLFQSIMSEDLDFENSSNVRTTHVCLGNTIGNFEEQDEILSIFARNSSKGDLLLLGVQLDTDFDTLFQKYSTNEQFSRLILNYLKNPDYSKLKWHRKEGVIKAYYDGIEVFRTRKYKPKKLQSEVEKFGYKLLEQTIDKERNACIQLYEKH